MNITARAPSKSAVAILAIDYQVENSPGRRWEVEGFEGMLSAASRLFSAARDTQTPMIHCRTLRLGEAGLAAEPRLDGDRPLYGDATSPDTEFIERLEPARDEICIDKTRSSAFDGTSLQATCIALGLTDLLVAGVWTEECVLLTVKEAIALGYRVWLVAEACASGSVALHKAATAIIAMRLYGGGVVGIESAVDLLHSRTFTAFSPALPEARLKSGAHLDQLYAEMIQRRAQRGYGLID